MGPFPFTISASCWKVSMALALLKPPHLGTPPAEKPPRAALTHTQRQEAGQQKP